MSFLTNYLHQEAMLQSGSCLTVPDGLAGEEQLYQLFGTELCRGLDCRHQHPLWTNGRTKKVTALCTFRTYERQCIGGKATAAINYICESCKYDRR